MRKDLRPDGTPYQRRKTNKKNRGNPRSLQKYREGRSILSSTPESPVCSSKQNTEATITPVSLPPESVDQMLDERADMDCPSLIPVMIKSEPGMTVQDPENEEFHDTDRRIKHALRAAEATVKRDTNHGPQPWGISQVYSQQSPPADEVTAQGDTNYDPQPWEGLEVSIKNEPTESVSDSEGLDNPYQCFTCGLDCESQEELITHYETKCWAQDVGSNEESMEAEGVDDMKTGGTDDDPLIGDEAPSDRRVQNIGQAYGNSEDPHQLLFYCAFCGVASNEKQELMVHMESHVEVTYLSCAHCVHVYSDKYHLKNYKCRDELEKPHVCVHCPFRTQWWQELKDHCFSHHHRDVNPPQNVNQVASLGPSVSSANHHFLSGDLQPIHSAGTGEQQLRIHNANKDYYVVVKNFGNSTGSGTNSAGSATLTPGASTNEEYLKHLLVSNSRNVVTGPMLQSSKYLNSVSLTKQDKQKTPSLVPVNASAPNLSQMAPDPSLSPVKTEGQATPNVLQVPVVVQGWSQNVRVIAPRPPEVPGPQNLPTVIPREHLTQFKSTVKPSTQAVGPANGTAQGSGKKKSGFHRDKKIPCPYCEYLSRDKWNLRTHILTHTKEKPFSCPLCPYRASQAAHLRKHMHIHRRKMMGQ